MRNFIYPDKTVSDTVERITEQAASKYKSDLQEYIWNTSSTDSNLESPIEKIMWASLLSIDWGFWELSLEDLSASPVVAGSNWLLKRYPTEHEFISERLDSKCSGLYIFSQYPIGKYRADFGIFFFTPWGIGRYGKLAVECDGHDFHEKTKEQASRDKSRDRYFHSKGWPVIRFTGSEIVKDPYARALEVREIVDERVGQFIREDQRA